MIRIFLLLVSLFLTLLACNDSSENRIGQADSIDIRNDDSLDVIDNFPECEKITQSAIPAKELFSLKSSSDTVCIYNDFPFKDTICCYGEPGMFLQRDEKGQYMSVGTDYAVGEVVDTLSATVSASSIEKCKANVGDEYYKAVKIGSQIWFSENVKGGIRCLFDDNENCSMFGSLMTYEKAKESCSGVFRLPTNDDVEILLQSVGVEVKRTYTKDVCGEIPKRTLYYNAPLFVKSNDSTQSMNAYGFSFHTSGGVFEKGIQGEDYAFNTEKTCFFLQSDENTEFRNAFCYYVDKEYFILESVDKKAELYARCIIN